MSKEARLLDLTRTLTLRQIPYHPPLKGESLERLKRNNLKGYLLLIEYLELEAQKKNHQF